MIDLDANATTPVDPRVIEAMTPHLLAGGNPESRHAPGRRARKAWEDARESIAEILGARPDDLIFTSGGTESNNLAVVGFLNRYRELSGETCPRVICSTIEHPAVAEPLEEMDRRGLIALDRISVTPEGIVDIDAFESMISAGTRPPALIAIMMANNETGAIQPIGQLSEMAHAAGIAFHTDAVQAVGRIDVHFHELQVDLLAAGSHKLHGPPGIGLLLVKKGTRIEPLFRGGGQQKAQRPGTPPVALAVGFAEALRLFHLEKNERHSRWIAFQELFFDLLKSKVQGLPVQILRNGPVDQAKRLPQTINLWVDHPAFIGELALMQIDLAGLAISLGSACASGSTRPSPVLMAMGFSPDRAKNSMRLSFSARTTESEIHESAEILAEVVRQCTT